MAAKSISLLMNVKDKRSDIYLQYNEELTLKQEGTYQALLKSHWETPEEQNK